MIQENVCTYTADLSSKGLFGKDKQLSYAAAMGP